MPSWDAYREAARARGSLAFELYVVLSIPAATQEDLKANLPDHLAYQNRLEAEGLLAFAGPLSARPVFTRPAPKCTVWA